MHEETLAANQQRLLEVSMVAEQLAEELRAREDAMTKQAAKMSKQADEVTQLQQSLWSAEEELTQLIERTATDQSLVPFLEASNRTQTASPKSPKPSWEILLPYLPAIAAGEIPQLVQLFLMSPFYVKHKNALSLAGQSLSSYPSAIGAIKVSASCILPF